VPERTLPKARPKKKPPTWRGGLYSRGLSIAPRAPSWKPWIRSDWPIRLSPGFVGMGLDRGSEGPRLFRYLAAELDKLVLAYVHIVNVA